MIEITEDKIYRVKNFAKHQNIKVKEKIESKDKAEDIKDKQVQVNENFKNEIYDNEDKESENKISQNQAENAKNYEIGNVEINHKNIKKINNNLSDETINNASQNIIPILLETKKNKPENKKKQKDNIEEENKEDTMVWINDGGEIRPLEEGESVVQAWCF